MFKHVGRLQATASLAAEAFVRALAARDFERLERSLAPRVRFRALIPPGPASATGATQTVALLRKWFEDAQDVRLVDKQVGLVGDRVSITYRLELEEDGPRVVEQHAYADVADGRITTLDLLCSGFRLIATNNDKRRTGGVSDAG